MPPTTLHARARDSRWVGEMLVVASIYFVTARLGLLLAMPGGHVTPVWPPSGIALAAVLLFGRRVWPGIWLGSFAANFIDFQGSPMGLVTELGAATVLGVGGSLTALAGEWLLRRFGVGPNPLQRVRDVGALLALGGMVSCLLSATLGVSTLCLAGFAPWSHFGEIWLTWWLGDTAGVFVAAPLLLVWSGPDQFRSKGRVIEFVGCFGLLIVVTCFVFIVNTTAQPLAFILIPMLVWPAIRFGRRGAVLAVGVIALLAVWGTIHQTGPFGTEQRNEALLLLELFLSMVVLTALSMAAMVAERDEARAAQQQTVVELESRVRERTAALTHSEAETRAHLAEAVHSRGALLNLLEEQRATENSLRLSNERFQVVARATNDAVWDWDLLTNGVWWNQGFQTLFGYAAEEIEPGVESWTGRLHAADKDRVLHGIHEMIGASGTEWSDEYRFLRRDGSYAVVFDRGHIVRDAQGRAIRMIGAMQDITGRKQTEDLLRENERYVRDILDNLAAFVALLTPDGTILEVNRAPLEAAGLRREEVVGKDLSETYWCRGVPEVQVQLRAAIGRAAAGEIVVGDFRLRMAQGVMMDVFAVFAPLRDASGGIVKVIGSGFDITQRKQAEAERQSLEGQLRQSQKLEAIGTLAGGIAHDFNNILAGITGFTSLAHSAAVGNVELQDYLGEVSRAGKRAAELVQQILAFSRAGDQVMVPVQWRHVVAESVKLLRAAIPSTIEIETNLTTVLPAVLGNGTQLHQIMMNLGTNAAQAMRDRNGRLSIGLDAVAVNAEYARTLAGLEPGRCVRLTVSDTGAGIDPKTQERIFEPFFTTKGPGEGSGLGLAVVHGIVRSHCGAIRLTSEVGRGTTFEIFLPAIEAAPVPETAEPETLPVGQGERILVVDDEPMLVKFVECALGKLGYVVAGETDVLEALRRLEREPQAFHLVITDQTMPGMTGLEFAERVRILRADLPIVLASGFSLALTPERVHAAGVRELLAKPYAFAGLAQVVSRHLPKKIGA